MLLRRLTRCDRCGYSTPPPPAIIWWGTTARPPFRGGRARSSAEMPCMKRSARKTIDDINQLGEAFDVFVGPARHAVRNTLLDVEFENNVTDASDRRFGRCELLKYGDTRA